MLLSRQTYRWVCAAVLGGAVLVATSSDTQAGSKKQKPLRTPLMFDIDYRKKTKTQLSERLSTTAYASVRHQGERNIKLDDDTSDKSSENAAYLGLAARADLGNRLIAFGHAEAYIRDKTTHYRRHVRCSAQIPNCRP